MKRLPTLLYAIATIPALLHAATWTVDPYYQLKQTSTAGSNRYVATKLPIGSDVKLAPAIPKTESTLFTTWATTPYYLIKERSDGGSTRYTATDLLVNFTGAVEPSYGCKYDEAVIFDPKFGGIKLPLQPTLINPSPCMCIKLTDGAWSQYSCESIKGCMQ
jgi:hypothetical protein